MAKLIIANWKMNPETLFRAIQLAKAEDFENVVIAAPFVFLKNISNTLKKAALAAQDVAWAVKGAYTGEISVGQLKQMNIQYVIIGHSERRYWFKETETVINRKLKIVLGAGLKAILCVGEDWSMRKKGLVAAENFIKKQLAADLKSISVFTNQSAAKIKNLLIAYEPIWAIGTGRHDNPRNAAVIAEFIKKFIHSKFKIQNLKVLYGGSVNSRNAGLFLEQKTIDGLLVGGASLKTAEFKKIIKLAGL